MKSNLQQKHESIYQSHANQWIKENCETQEDEDDHEEYLRLAQEEAER